MRSLEFVAVALVLAAALAGGAPLWLEGARERARAGWPGAEAFSAGVFLALALLLMLPAGFQRFAEALPSVAFPVAPLLCSASFLALLGVAHAANRLEKRSAAGETTPSAIPIAMTWMIAVPSFLLGTALGIGDEMSALFILLAVLAHKSSAGFGLALAMLRSRLGLGAARAWYALFAAATPIGILAGADARSALEGPQVDLAKAWVFSLAAGVFLFMATTHGLRDAPLIRHCGSPRCFSWMLCGFSLTVGVRLILGLGHLG